MQIPKTIIEKCYYLSLIVQPGVTTAVSDGYWIIVKPLLPGTHEIDFGAQGTYNGSHFRTHVKYSVTSKQNSN